MGNWGSHPFCDHASTLSPASGTIAQSAYEAACSEHFGCVHMSARTTIWLARGAGSVILALTAAALLLAYVGRATIPGGVLSAAGATTWPVVFAGLGVVIAARQPRNRIGWILLGIAGATAADNLALTGANYAELVGTSSSGWAIWLGWFQNWFWLSYFPGGLVVLFVLLPDGRLPGRRWRWLIWFDLLYIPVLMAAMALTPTPIRLAAGLPALQNPVGFGALADLPKSTIAGVAHFGPLLPLCLLAIAAMIIRDGHGFDRVGMVRGAGLTNMDDRLDALGGSFEVASTPGKGTRVTASIPTMVEAPA
jgi:hypothetical protein